MTAATTRRVTPTARLVLPADADREVWLAARRAGVGSSDVPAILGVSPYTTALHVYYDKTGELPPQDAGEAAMWGNLLEEAVAREWARRNKAIISRVGLVAQLDSAWKLATLDRKVAGCSRPVDPRHQLNRRDCMLEVKTRSAWVAGKWGRGVPDDVHGQVAWAMHVTGYDHAHVAVLIGGQEFRQFTVDRDPDLEAMVVPVVHKFWHHQVGLRVPPPADEVDPEQRVELYQRLYPDRGGSVEVDALAAYEQLLIYDEAGAQMNAHKDFRAAAKAKLIELLGPAAVATVDGEQVYSYPSTSRRSVDFQRLQDEHPAAYAACVTESTAPTFRVAKNYTKVLGERRG